MNGVCHWRLFGRNEKPRDGAASFCSFREGVRFGHGIECLGGWSIRKRESMRAMKGGSSSRVLVVFGLQTHCHCEHKHQRRDEADEGVSKI